MKNQKGMTLIEVMIIIMIVGGLVAILAETISRANSNQPKVEQSTEWVEEVE